MEEFFPKVKLPYETRETDYETERGTADVVTDTVRSGYNWVFDQSDDVIAVEKIDGENVLVEFNSDNEPVGMYRRNGFQYVGDERVYNMENVPLWQEDESHYAEGVVNAFGKGWIEYIDTPGVFAGELVGPRIQGNRYDLEKHYWVPFGYAHEKLAYESYGDYSTEFDAISDWFNGNLIPLFYSKMHGGMSFDKASERVDVEGVVFVAPESEGQKPMERDMAKLRQSDFKWYYLGT